MQVLSIAFRIYFAKLAYNMIKGLLKIIVQATNKNLFAGGTTKLFRIFYITMGVPTYSQLLQ